MAYIVTIQRITMYYFICNICVRLGAKMTAAKFNLISRQVLEVMCEFASKKSLRGVAVLACLENDDNNDWICRMKVCGAIRSAAVGLRGLNYAAVSFSKMAEMMNTKKDSGKAPDQLLVGELGLEGGVIIKDGQGYIAASFAGGSPEDDYAVSLRGVAFLQSII